MNTEKRALVTGGSSGLGLHVAMELAKRGYVLTLVGRDRQRLQTAIGALAGAGHETVALDLSSANDAAKLVEIIARSSFDLLVNNAGGAQFGRLTSLDAETIDRNLRLNFETPVRLSWAFLKSAKRDSVLVNVTSVVGTVPIPGNAIYCGAKAGLQKVTECLWYEAADTGIRVLDFRPAGMSTGFHHSAGGESMSGGMVATPEAAARDLVAAVAAERSFVYSYGLPAALGELARRIVPAKLLLTLAGNKSRKMRYLDIKSPESR